MTNLSRSIEYSSVYVWFVLQSMCMNFDLCICSFAKTEWKDDFVFLWYNAEIVINDYTNKYCNSDFTFLLKMYSYKLAYF